MKPIDLIVANVMHEAVDRIGRFDDLFAALKLKAGPEAASKLDWLVEDEVARRLLWMIAMEASIDVVFRSLHAAGAPSARDLIRDGMQAVIDRQGAPR